MRDFWFKALKKFERKDILAGLAKCVDSGKAFITLPEFVAMCKTSNHDKMIPFYKSLPSTHASDEVRDKGIKLIRAILVSAKKN